MKGHWIAIIFVSVIILGVLAITSVNAQGKYEIPSWIKNTAKWWSSGNVSDKEFINAIKFLIQNDILILESDKVDGFVDVQGELFTILYPEKTMQNPKSLGGVTYIETQPFFAFDESKKVVYDEIGNLDKSQNTVFVYPMFTQSAYEEPGFYTFYNKQCDESCLTVPIKDDLKATYTSSGNAATILALLGYDLITDMDIDKNPSIIQKYDKVIMLHNEYVTQKIFDAVTSHPRVIYLYPNALYAKVDVDYESNTITLNRGHGYPESSISNGFNWEYDNTHPYEFDVDCIDWKFYEIENGIMLNCYPEHIIYKDVELLRQIKFY